MLKNAGEQEKYDMMKKLAPRETHTQRTVSDEWQ